MLDSKGVRGERVQGEGQREDEEVDQEGAGDHSPSDSISPLHGVE